VRAAGVRSCPTPGTSPPPQRTAGVGQDLTHAAPADPGCGPPPGPAAANGRWRRSRISRRSAARTRHRRMSAFAPLLEKERTIAGKLRQRVASTSAALVLREALASQALPQDEGGSTARVNAGTVGHSLCTSSNLHRRCFRSSRCSRLAGRRSRSFHYMIARRGRRSSLGFHRVCTWPHTTPSPGRRRRSARGTEPPTLPEPRRG